MMALILENDFEVFESGGGEAALELARRIQPALIFCDSLMPAMPGAELVRRLRAHQATERTPVVIVTGRSDPEDWSGERIDGLVAKPFHFEELLETAHRVINSAANAPS